MPTALSSSAISGRREARQRRVASRINTVADARRLARSRVPRPVFDYIEGGAGSESTVLANQQEVEAVRFRPRVGQTVGVPGPDLATTVLGTPVSMPLLLSPVGFTRMMDPRGDVAAARAASTAGTLFTLSSMSGHGIEEVAAVVDPPAWFQLYFLGGRPGAEQLVDQAQAAGYGALVVTLDTQVPGNRERDLRYGLSPPLELNPGTALKMAPHAALHPRWLADLARDRFRLELVNTTGLELDHQPISAGEALIHWLASPPRWDDFTWLREHFDGPVIAKGILTGDDARRARDCGVAAIVVSNHGGRQLDCAPATMTALVEVLDAVGTDVEVFVDGGFRRGADVVKAVALGARAVMVGRPWAYGLAAAGEPGVDRILTILRDDIDRTMRLLGASTIADLDRGLVDLPGTA